MQPRLPPLFVHTGRTRRRSCSHSCNIHSVFNHTLRYMNALGGGFLRIRLDGRGNGPCRVEVATGSSSVRDSKALKELYFFFAFARYLDRYLNSGEAAKSSLPSSYVSLPFRLFEELCKSRTEGTVGNKSQYISLAAKYGPPKHGIPFSP